MFVTCLAAFSSLITFDAPPCYLVPEEGTVERHVSVNFTISIKQRNLEQLEEAALAVSSPRSARYGKHLSKEEIERLTAPSPNDSNTVTRWLSSHGARFTLQRELARVSTTVEIAERMLHTTFRRFRKGSGTQLLRAGAYKLPKAIDAAISTIFGLHGAPLPTLPKSATPTAANLPTATSPSSPADVTPAVIASTYSIRQSVDRNGTNLQAVAEFQANRMAKEDLAAFFEKFVPASMPGDEQVSRFVGSPYKRGAGVEADLDVQYLMGVAPGVKTEFWEYESNDFCADLHSYTSAILDSETPAHVHSLSYGWQGNLSQVGCRAVDVSAVDINLAKLAARGISMVVSSGDSGAGIPLDPGCDPSDPHAMTKDIEITSGVMLAQAASVTPETCCMAFHNFHPGAAGWTFAPADAVNAGKCTFYSKVDSTGTKKGSTSGGPRVVPPIERRLYPSWPASSPWVTAVGATRFDEQRVGADEIVCDQFGSGGGFSYDFDRTKATWQETAVKTYLKLNDTLPKFPPEGWYQPSGRGTPDVAALGEGYQIFVGGVIQTIGGTSAAAPAFAAVVSLLNEARLAAAKPPMGFLNPFLYEHPQAFFDVRNGTNAISRTGSELEYGYAAATGWDPATGLGTPHFDKLLDAAMALV